MKINVYNPKSGTTLTSLGVGIVESKLNKMKKVVSKNQATVVNVGNVLKLKTYRDRGVDLVMHVKRHKLDTENDVVTIAVSTGANKVNDDEVELVDFSTISDDSKRIRAAGDFLKTDARMWYFLSLSTATLYQFSTQVVRSWFKSEVGFTHDWFEPRACDLLDLQKNDPRWIILSSHGAFDLKYNAWAVQIPLSEVLLGVEKITGSKVQPVDVLEELVRVAHANGVLMEVWQGLRKKEQARALEIVEKYKLAFGNTFIEDNLDVFSGV